ncbi:hypothetical protein NSK_003952 [Nannochloropsis salina CCMP1776]|uniref:Uncharacterized protein n=2 Tax=Nannochloropsis salina CCMP1776 TaxID=1027361 RepID=A0A4D9CZU5_9STRA|nr:hypothetical protein NSK_003952 [Nannochloropsis salina CCMP1776]|eukprot:TFJ84921.1 hypothetical protein NSK_003952 [Nannochloropsis salina CCMP1776]
MSSLSPLARTVLRALPTVLVVVSFLVTCGPVVAHAAASSSLPTSVTPTRVNKVKEYILKPIGQWVGGIGNAPPLKMVRDTSLSLCSWTTHGPMGQSLAKAWNEPVARYMLDPTAPVGPYNLPGRVLEAIQARIPPSWSPLGVVALLSFLPIFEARVGVPFGLALGAPWLKALVVGLAANAVAIPVAAGVGLFCKNVEGVSPVLETATAARTRYQTFERAYQELQGKLSVKTSLLEEEETGLRTTIDRAIDVVRRGQVLMDKATRQGLVREITEASRLLLQLNDADTRQFYARLEEQFFDTSVGSVLPDNEDDGFADVTVAELGQRRVELAWYPDVTLFPMLGQAVVTYQLEEIAAQAQADFCVRPRELLLLREEVASLKQEVEREGGRLKAAAKKAAEAGKETVGLARELESGVLTPEEKTEARKRAMAEAKEATTSETGPGSFVPIAEREKEEDARVAELQMRGTLMKNYGWPKAIVYVGLPLPLSGAWTAMFWSTCLGMKYGPSARGTLVGVGLSTLIGLALWLAGPTGVLVYALVLALLYGEENPWTVLGRGLVTVKEGLVGFLGGKGKR